MLFELVSEMVWRVQLGFRVAFPIFDLVKRSKELVVETPELRARRGGIERVTCDVAHLLDQLLPA